MLLYYNASLDTFILHRVAEICIKLRNRGDDAYRQDEYGLSIIVERKLRAEGGTAYKLKAASGKVISTKREELSHILDHFNIQVRIILSCENQKGVNAVQWCSVANQEGAIKTDFVQW